MLLALRYPAMFEAADEAVIVRFRDLPEALSEGTDVDVASVNAVDCLDMALHFRMKDNLAIPPPSVERPGEVGIVPSTRTSMRVALYQAYRASGLSMKDFSRVTGMTHAQLRAIFTTHRSFDVAKVAEDLRKLGRPVVLSIDAA